MLIKIGRGFVDPLSVIGISPQTSMATDEEYLLIWLEGVSHPMVHDTYEGTIEEETIRIAQMLNDGIEYERKNKTSSSEFFESGSPDDHGEHMIRMPVDELHSKVEAAWQAGWDERSRGLVMKQCTLKKELLEALYLALAASFRTNMSDAEREHLVVENIRIGFERVADDLGGKIEWVA